MPCRRPGCGSAAATRPMSRTWRLADHRGRAHLPRHAARAQIAPRGPDRPARARAGRRDAGARGGDVPIPSARRCSSCSRHCSRRNGSPSCCTTCSQSPSRRSRRSSDARSTPRGSSRAARAARPGRAGARGGHLAPARRSSMPSSGLRARAISRGCWPCSIPTSCSAPTRLRCGSARCRRSAARMRSPALQGPCAGCTDGAGRWRDRRRRHLRRTSAHRAAHDVQRRPDRGDRGGSRCGPDRDDGGGGAGALAGRGIGLSGCYACRRNRARCQRSRRERTISMTARFIPLLALSLLGLAAGSTTALAAADEKLKAAAEQEKPPLIETLQRHGDDRVRQQRCRRPEEDGRLHRGAAEGAGRHDRAAQDHARYAAPTW